MGNFSVEFQLSPFRNDFQNSRFNLGCFLTTFTGHFCASSLGILSSFLCLFQLFSNIERVQYWTFLARFSWISNIPAFLIGRHYFRRSKSVKEVSVCIIFVLSLKYMYCTMNPAAFQSSTRDITLQKCKNP